MTQVTKKKSPTRRALSTTNVQTDQKIDRQVTSDWIPFFRETDNIYPNDLAQRARRSSTHGAILKSKHVFTIGEMFLYFKDEESYQPVEKELSWLTLVNKNNESFFDVFSKIARDYIMFGNAYVEGVRVDDRLNLFHKDATKVRIGKKKDKFYISSFWRDIKINPTPRDEFTIDTIDAFDGTDKQKNFLIQIANYEPEFDFYGLPDYHGVLKWADIEYKIPTYNLDRFKNGFFPSIYMALFGEPPKGKTPEQYTKDIVDTFTGEGNNSRAIVEMLDSVEEKSFIHEFSTVREGEFVELDKLAVENIISGHRWFASLAGISTAGKLGSNQQIISEFEIAMNTVVIPDYQKPLLRLMDELIRLAGFEFTVGIKRGSPISFISDIDPEKVTLIKEGRKGFGLPALMIKEEPDPRGDEFISKNGITRGVTNG